MTQCILVRFSWYWMWVQRTCFPWSNYKKNKLKRICSNHVQWKMESNCIQFVWADREHWVNSFLFSRKMIRQGDHGKAPQKHLAFVSYLFANKIHWNGWYLRENSSIANKWGKNAMYAISTSPLKKKKTKIGTTQSYTIRKNRATRKFKRCIQITKNEGNHTRKAQQRQHREENSKRITYVYCCWFDADALHRNVLWKGIAHICEKIDREQKPERTA